MNEWKSVLKSGAALSSSAGLVMLFVYFNHIGLVPDINFPALTHILVVATIVGAVLVLFFGAVLFYPGLAWLQAFPGSQDNRKEALLWLLPPAIIMILLVWVLDLSTMGLILFSVIALAWIGIIVMSKPRQEKESRFSVLLQILQVFIGYLFLFPVVLLMTKGEAMTSTEVKSVFSVLVVVIAMSNVVFAVGPIPGFMPNASESNRRLLWWLLIIPLVVFSVFIMTNKGSVIPRVVVSWLRLGDIRNVTIVVGKETGEAIRTIGIDATESAGPSLYRISSLTVLWHLGGEYVFQDGMARRFVVPKSAILSLCFQGDRDSKNC